MSSRLLRLSRANFLTSSLTRVKERGEVLVNLGIDVGKPFHEAVALERASRRRQLGGGVAVGDVLQDGHVFGEDFAVVEPQNRDITFRVEPVELLTVGGLAGLAVEGG